MARPARRDCGVLIAAAIAAWRELAAACEESKRLMAKLRKAMKRHHGRIDDGMHRLSGNIITQSTGRRVTFADYLVPWREVHEGGVALAEAMAELQANQARIDALRAVLSHKMLVVAIIFALGK